MALQGFSGRSLQGFTRSLQGFGSGVGDIFISSQDSARALSYRPNGDLNFAFGSITFPNGIALANSNIYVCDFTGGKVLIYDMAGVYVSEFSVTQPTGIASYNNEIYVSTTGSSPKVRVYDFIGTLQREWSTHAVTPLGISVMDDEVYVCEVEGSPSVTKIVVYDTNGLYIRKWGEEGTDDGEFSSRATGICAYRSEIYVSMRALVQVFTTNGGFIRKFTVNSAPITSDIAVKGGKVFVSGELNGKVSIHIHTIAGALIRDIETIDSISGTGNIVGIAVS